jgi:hypothetical protein
MLLSITKTGAFFMTVTKFYTPPQVGRILRCGADHVLAHIRSGELKASNLSLTGDRPRWKINPDDLQAFLDSRSNQGTVKAKPKRVKTETIRSYF